MGRSVVRRRYYGHQRHSKRVRRTQHLQVLKEEGRKIAVFELQGPLFFGSGDNLVSAVEEDGNNDPYCVLDMQHVSEIDSSGANMLIYIHNRMTRENRRLLIGYIWPKHPLWGFLKAMHVVDKIGSSQFCSGSGHRYGHPA